MMQYINKPRYGFSLFINQSIVLFNILLFCSSCFEDVKDQYKKVEEYEESIDLEELESIPKKDVLSKDKEDDFTNCINKEKPIEKEKKDSKTSVKESVRLQTSKEPSGPSIEEERKRREKEIESLRQKRIIEITLLEQSMQSLGSRLQSAHESRLNREAEIARNQQAEEQARLRREEERVRIERELQEARVRLAEEIARRQQEEAQARLRREEERVRIEQEDQAHAIRAEERIEQEAILASIRTEAARVRHQEARDQARIRSLPMRSPIVNEENNSDIRTAIEASRLTASRHRRSSTPPVMSIEKVIEKLKGKLSKFSGSQNEECPICLSDFLANREDCYQLTTCCNKVLHINCIANGSVQ